ncbi:hypothetical protein [Candidatus Paracaedibacter symbiosus]|uniref:hypothetical protein n=1 Tax=Candidatus Paracaedibacter symbiosus TaxID=244582 RepID=UPI0012EB3B2F|nr:hypothetical protein [Candidatus Paracaedibacter symbiosus]
MTIKDNNFNLFLAELPQLWKTAGKKSCSGMGLSLCAESVENYNNKLFESDLAQEGCLLIVFCTNKRSPEISLKNANFRLHLLSNHLDKTPAAQGTFSILL